jgi:hypothetical protein
LKSLPTKNDWIARIHADVSPDQTPERARGSHELIPSDEKHSCEGQTKSNPVVNGSGLPNLEVLFVCPQSSHVPSRHMPKRSTAALLLEGKTHLLRLLQEIPLGEAEQAAVEDGVPAYENLLSKLADVPTPAGPTPRQLGAEFVQITTVRSPTSCANWDAKMISSGTRWFQAAPIQLGKVTGPRGSADHLRLTRWNATCARPDQRGDLLVLFFMIDVAQYPT